MPRLSKEELKTLKQDGGSPVAALLLVAGIGVVLGSILMMSSGLSVYGTGTTVVTGPGMGPTVIVNNPQPMYGYNNGYGDFAAGVVVGEAISDNDSAELLPQNQYGGWVKNNNEYYHYHVTKTDKGNDVVLIRKYKKVL